MSILRTLSAIGLTGFMLASLSGCAGKPLFDRNVFTGSSSDPEQAEQDTQEQMSSLKDSAEVDGLAKRAEEAYQARNLALATTLFKDVLAANPDHVNAHYRLGNLSFLANDYEASRDHFAKVVALDPRQAKGHYNLAVIHLILAESHFKYYAATDESANLDPIVQLLSHIQNFSDAQKGDNTPDYLDRIAEKLR